MCGVCLGTSGATTRNIFNHGNGDVSVTASSFGGYRCERCGFHGTDKQMELHHLHYDTLGREQTGDVQVLCARCHRGVHGLGPRSGFLLSLRAGDVRPLDPNPRPISVDPYNPQVLST